MHGIVQVGVGLVVVGALMAILERICRRRAPRPVLRGAILTDIIYWLFVPLVTRVVAPITLAICVLPIMALAGKGFSLAHVGDGFGPLARQPALLQGVELLVLADFLGYWSHRLFHGRALWRFHAVHHSTRDLYWLSAARLHPLNDLIGRVLTTLPLVALGFRPLLLAGAMPLLTLHAIFLHADVSWSFGPLRWIISSPRFHRWHHTSAAEGRAMNFSGLFPIWDILFGTFYLPTGEAVRFGIADPVPAGLLGQLWYPFSRGAR